RWVLRRRETGVRSEGLDRQTRHRVRDGAHRYPHLTHALISSWGGQSGLLSHWEKAGPVAGTSGVGIMAPSLIAFPAAPGTCSGMTTTGWPQCAMRVRTRSTRSAASGPATSTIWAPVGLVATSTRAWPTVRAAIGWIFILGTTAKGPIWVRARVWAGNSWNWVARTIETGSGPARAAASCSSFAV